MKQPLRVTLAAALLALVTAAAPALAADSIAPLEDEALASAQPRNSGYRLQGIRDWSPETDPYAEFLRADVPLQERIDRDPATQANPDLDGKAQIMLMQGDYGNAFFDNFRANNDFANNTFNYWQYADYWSPWHGSATAGTPSKLYDPATSDWRTRNFEFGIVDIPNPAYTNAAHRNGVKSIGTIYFDPAFRPGLTFREAFEKDPDSDGYVIAQKLVEMAEYYGFDGYFLNEEEANLTEEQFKPFMEYLTSHGLYTQWYTNSESTWSSQKEQWLQHDTIMNSVFLNYWWPGTQDASIQQATADGYDPYQHLFFGVEANQGGFGGKHPTSARLPELYQSSQHKSPRASVALFTPSDMYQRGLADDIEPAGQREDRPVFQEDPYQWMIAERERMYFSGVTEDVRDTGAKPGMTRPDVGVADAGGWSGVADFTPARSVIDGTQFSTTFTTGRGMQWYSGGRVSNRQQWSDMDAQSLLPSWQWWIDTEGTRPKVDFDYGSAEVRKDVSGAEIEAPFTPVGAWEGGSSLVVHGDLDAPSTVRLFKTSLDVTKRSELQITFKKTSGDDAPMSAALVFADDPGNVVHIEVPRSRTAGEWTTAKLPLREYQGRTISTIGLGFDSAQGYQMNIGQIALTDKAKAPAKPTGVALRQVYEDGQLVLAWDRADYGDVVGYQVEAEGATGQKAHLKTGYTGLAYIKNMPYVGGPVKLTVRAIGRDGRLSAPATLRYGYHKQVHSLTVDEAETESGLLTHAARPHEVTARWETSRSTRRTCTVTVQLQDVPAGSPEAQPFSTEVPCSDKTATVPVPIDEGYPYDVTVTTGGMGVSYRGNTHDSVAAPLADRDIVEEPERGGFHLQNPTAKDWYTVDLSWKATDGTVTDLSHIKRGGSVNGGWGAEPTTDDPTAFHAFPDTEGTLIIDVGDYSGNTTTQEIPVSGNRLVR